MHDSMDGGGRAASGTAAEEVGQRREQLPRMGMDVQSLDTLNPIPSLTLPLKGRDLQDQKVR